MADALDLFDVRLLEHPIESLQSFCTINGVAFCTINGVEHMRISALLRAEEVSVSDSPRHGRSAAYAALLPRKEFDRIPADIKRVQDCIGGDDTFHGDSFTSNLSGWQGSLERMAYDL